MAYADVTAAMNAAQTALGLGDYATARDKALAAQAFLAILPDVNRDTGGGGSQATTFDRRSIADFITTATRLANSSHGIGVSKVRIRPLHGEGCVQPGVW